MISGKKIGELLEELGFITKEQLKAALLHQKKNCPEEKVGEILVELGFLNELDLLRCLSGLFRIRYLSADKLSKMTIPQWVIDLISLEFAEKYKVFPFFCYDKTKILSVVIPEPQNKKLPNLIKKASGYHEVETYLALGSTIKAAIAKYYKSDQTAFGRLKGSTKTARPSAIASFLPKNEQVIDSEYSGPTGAALSQKSFLNKTTSEIVSDKGEPAAGAKEPQKRLSDQIASLSVMSEDTFIEVLNVLINVLEMYKGEAYRGHSAGVAKIVKEISRNMGLKAKETYYNVVGAYLHDCCMNSPEHLTLLHFNIKGGRGLLKKYSNSSKRVFEKARLPHEVQNILFHIFERYDGEGYPDGLKGEEIPMGSRIIASADAFVYLMNFGKNRSSENLYKTSFVTIESLASKYFDPEVIGGLEAVIIDHFVDDRSPRVIIIDGSSDEINELAYRLKKNGIIAYTSKDTDEAADILKGTPINLIISETNTQPMDGFSFCNLVKSDQKYKDVKFMFLSKDSDSATVSNSFNAGADDFIAKPYNSDILIAKIKNFVKPETKRTEETTERFTQKKGISGNLAEIQVIELIQMLSRGKKAGVLKLFKDEEHGEIFFNNGQIINAHYRDLEGRVAFNLLIRWEYGLFSLDPDAKISAEPKIHESTEMLLMEAYRVWDEQEKP